MEDFQKQKLELELQEKEIEVRDFFGGFEKRSRYLILALLILTIPAFFVAKYVTAQLYMSSYAQRELPAHAAVVATFPVKILDAGNLQIAGDAYSSYALIKNQNKELSTPDLKYIFHLYNFAGKEIYTSTSKTFLLAGEQKYLILPNVRLTEAPTSVKVEIPDPFWQKRLDLPNVILKTGIPEFGDQQSPEGFYIRGTVENQSVYTLRTVTIKGVVFDKDHKVIAVTQYSADTVGPKELRAYKMFWPVPLSSLIGGLPQISAETNVLDQTNLQ